MEAKRKFSTLDSCDIEANLRQSNKKFKSEKLNGITNTRSDAMALLRAQREIKTKREGEAKRLSECPVQSKKEYINSKQELNKIRLSRLQMEKFINLPIFEKVVLNCFVRINVGCNGECPIYKIAQIVGVVNTAKTYNLGNTLTNKGLRLRHGNEVRVIRLEFISNQDITESEFQEWHVACIKQKVGMPSTGLIERKLSDINTALNYEFNEAEVDKLVEEKNKLRKGPINYAKQKACLIKDRVEAISNGDCRLARDISEQIAELEEQAPKLDNKRSSSVSLKPYINDRYKKPNTAREENAALKEVRANKGSEVCDPCVRKPSRPQNIILNLRKNVVSDANKKVDQIDDIKGGKSDQIDDMEGGNSDQSHDLYALHDFDIDLDVKVPLVPLSVHPQPAIQPVTKRCISLAEYKKKRGLI